MDNILQVKAAKKDFESTNLSLITADGAFYSFVLEYAAEPSQLNIRFENQDEINAVQLTGQSSEWELEQEAGIVETLPSFLGVHRNRQRMRLALNGIFLSRNKMWFKLQLGNRSQIDFRPDYVRFFLRDKRKTKRTAIQETELLPVFTGMAEIIAGLETRSLPIAFEPFALPRNKRLVIQVGEYGGGRIIDLSVRSRTILKARRLQ